MITKLEQKARELSVYNGWTEPGVVKMSTDYQLQKHSQKGIETMTAELCDCISRAGGSYSCCAECAMLKLIEATDSYNQSEESAHELINAINAFK
ncbi:TPA: hypothetical protein NKQ52_005067 [Vibrio parahaemolyticus]|nr:hypothetical protein [Vibrio parahaemolyticus]HCH1657827.1 hypothetical protein [Vibrio parahaemolyticus]HCH1661194.1 hypothetical protein [Vibrio parahaemolyticus]